MKTEQFGSDLFLAQELTEIMPFKNYSLHVKTIYQYLLLQNHYLLFHKTLRTVPRSSQIKLTNEF